VLLTGTHRQQLRGQSVAPASLEVCAASGKTCGKFIPAGCEDRI
jgi:hypothetical protein